MEPNKLLVSSSPHLFDNSSTRRLMLNVIIALVPAAVAAGLIFGLRAIMLIFITIASSVIFEYCYCKLLKKDIPIGDLSAVVTGLLLALNLPPQLPYWMAVFGALVAIVVVKQMFGGLGFNFANPAIVARIVLVMSFANAMTTYAFPNSISQGIDGIATATPLATMAQGGSVPLLDLLLGTTGGVLGETCALALMLGGLYLIVTKVISPTIPFAYIGTVALFSFFAGQNVLAQLFAGGLMLGAFFMATDYVTSPFTVKGRIIFGIGLGLITCVIRFYGSMAEGVSFAILIMNMLVPYINKLTRQKVLGVVKVKKAKEEGAN